MMPQLQAQKCKIGHAISKEWHILFSLSITATCANCLWPRVVGKCADTTISSKCVIPDVAWAIVWRDVVSWLHRTRRKCMISLDGSCHVMSWWGKGLLFKWRNLILCSWIFTILLNTSALDIKDLLYTLYWFWWWAEISYEGWERRDVFFFTIK